ncbi:DUF4041 domain-containing protein [Candidatus Poribacteria bacterium]|nr:MAG: DUF4041 domain-containing protein [Candidatus Poribacteria bacterium]
MLTEISVSTAIGLLILVIYLMWLAIKQKRNLARFQGVLDVEAEKMKVKAALEAEREEINTAITQLYQQRDKIREEKSRVEGKLASLNRQLSTLEDEVNIQSYGLYQPKYDLGFSTELKNRLDQIRKKQKTMIREKTAIICSTDWTVDGSRTDGKKMTNRQIQLMARAFNGECDSIVPKVRYNNYGRIVDRMTRVYDAINKLGEPQHCRIQESYFNLKIDELVVVHEYQEQLQFEKEEQRRINEQIREEQRAQRELEKAQQEAEKEEKRYQRALDEARQEIEQATGKRQEKLQTEIQRLNELLLEAQVNKERAMSRAQMTRSGHVYIISNIGSFGENVYKIGMTRRLEPTDRVRELGDASVPFRFDIHAMIYSEDAPALENHLHGLLEKRSVNRINSRKEFFNVSLEEVEEIVRKYNVEAQFIRVPPAEEFRKTQAIITQERQSDAGGSK